MEQIRDYINYNKRIKELNEEKKILKQSIDDIKQNVLEYIKTNQGGQVVYNDSTITLYHKKVYEKKNVKDRLLKKLKPENVEKILEIINDKKFEEVEELKIKI